MSNVITFPGTSPLAVTISDGELTRDVAEARTNIREYEMRVRVVQGCLEWWQNELQRLEARQQAPRLGPAA